MKDPRPPGDIATYLICAALWAALVILLVGAILEHKAERAINEDFPAIVETIHESPGGAKRD